jgi:Xaa-Pro aminopeptidase
VRCFLFSSGIALTRIDNLRKAAFAESGYDGYIIFGNKNQFYFLGFPGTAALLVPPDGECTVYVYGVNYEQAKAQGKGFNVELVRADENLLGKIANQIICGKIGKLAVDALGVQSWKSLTKELPVGISLEVNNSYIEALRMIKDKEEIDLMRKAGELTSEGMKAAYEVIKPGVREYEAAAEIEYAMRKKGAGPTAFETVLASGACSAFPHGGCSGRIIRDSDLVVVDIGATHNYYCSDMTRSLVAGKSSEKQRKIHAIVKRAQEEAFEAIEPGIAVADLDAVARQIIASAGYSEYFVHRLGHGVGLEVHEPPSMGPNGKGILSVGCVVTDEPGIYIPGFGGVRIEDTVLVNKNGAEKLTVGPYSLNSK